MLVYLNSVTDVNIRQVWQWKTSVKIDQEKWLSSFCKWNTSVS